MIDLAAPISSWMETAWAPGHRPGLPDLCVGLFPPAFGRTGPARWKVWIVETMEERRRLEAALAAPVPRQSGALDFRSGPDAACSAPSRGETFLALYEPARPDWPWITLGAWPPAVAAGSGFARGRYTVEADDTAEEAFARFGRLKASLPAAAIIEPPTYRPQ